MSFVTTLAAIEPFAKVDVEALHPVRMGSR